MQKPIYFDQIHPLLLPFQLLPPFIPNYHMFFLKSQVPLVLPVCMGLGVGYPSTWEL